MSLHINQLDIFIGQKIRYFRKKMGWGLKVLSYKINISIPQLQKYEQGTNKISASMLHLIAQTFEIPIESFFCTTSTEGLDRNSFNILLIEDDLPSELAIREIIANSLSRIDLYVVKNTSSAIEFLQKTSLTSEAQEFTKPDLIVLDMQLPKTDSTEILHILKQNINFRHIPVVILTNTTNMKEVLISYNLYASSIILKSSRTEDFKMQMQTIITYWTDTVTLPEPCLN